MKKGDKLGDVLYFLEIKDLRNTAVLLGTYPSLRGAVKTASEVVVNMDNYSKVYREYTAMHGVFAGVYFAQNPNGSPIDKGSRHLFVVIHSSKIQHSDADDLKAKKQQMTKAHFSRLPGYTDAFPESGSNS
jgi:hypothetical protein